MSSRGAGNDGSKKSLGRALEPENEVSLGGIATKEGRGRREELKDGSISEGNSRGHIGEEGNGLHVKRRVAREKSQKRVAIIRRATKPLKVVKDGINDVREKLLGTPTTMEDAVVGIARRPTGQAVGRYQDGEKGGEPRKLNVKGRAHCRKMEERKR
jgi:hypothetical protein